MTQKPTMGRIVHYMPPEQAPPVFRFRNPEGDIEPYVQACHMLHEQAHGTDTAWRFCVQQPCRDLPQRDAGPAPWTSIGLF